jgi:hypothetical protein
MYDLEQDPGEREQLGFDHPHYQILDRQLGAVLQALRARTAALGDESEPVLLPEEMEESLRDLGYIQ